MEQYDESLVHYQKAKSIAQRIDDSYLMVIILRGIADSHRGRNRHDDALSEYNTALSLAREIGDLYHQAEVLYGIAESMFHTRGLDAGRIFWRQALEIFQQLDAPEAQYVKLRLHALGASIS
jgi:tetratricopeptide (TPR) repeat protein